MGKLLQQNAITHFDAEAWHVQVRCRSQEEVDVDLAQEEVSRLEREVFDRRPELRGVQNLL